MPRGIPNAKRDETGMRYTMFSVPLAPNPKHVSSTYLKSEGQTLWARNSYRKGKAPAIEETTTTPQDQRRGSNVIEKGSEALSSAPQDGDEYDVSVASDDPFEAKIAAISVSLRDRMRFYKLRVTPNATTIASTFNEQFKPEIIAEHADGPFHVDWIDGTAGSEVLVGEDALRISDPFKSNYVVRWPIYGSNFNTRDYSSVQFVLADLEAIIEATLKDRLNIEAVDYKNHSVVLVIPDFYERGYVRELINLLIVMGFKQFCVQQESLAATYGAGISNACVVDIGATITSVACVDEGLVIPDTRMFLNIGGDDITEFLAVLLGRISFPYRELNLARSYDWNVMEDLKSRLCTLAEGDVALNLYDFIVRKPNQPTEKYGLRAYDEIILAPMCIFEPRVVEFENKRAGFRPISTGVTEEIIDHQADYVTNAMVISTQHLMPVVPESGSTQYKTHPIILPSTPGTSTPAKNENDPMAMVVDASSAPVTIDISVDEPIDVDVDSKPPAAQVHGTPQTLDNHNPQKTYVGGYAIDVSFEASKLPLDVAIFNSARAAGGDEKIRKYLQAVLVIGGTALVPGMAHALESRLQAIATPLVPGMEKVQIIPPPKEVDPRVVAWKGAAVLGKMDSVSELWVTPSDWDVLGMRGLKERCFYL
ncbi:nucleus protein [Crucibulum laeve]|uniref:Nucleus protein n=1 Tax=Crucibulum laeve TaxID=68775 RepID=A0A5C3M3S8_9AGAR|nr:nucleus protein [Crucibulum laeve]